MIRVGAKQEYAGFNADVRIPGNAFLVNCPQPTSEQFRKKNFWSKAAQQLHSAYSGVCAYTSMYLPEQWSVDHYHPKTTHPHLAYEWSNYRLASPRVNSTKGNNATILDPFVVEDHWFHMDIPDCLLRANPLLEKALKSEIAGTINSLRLNQDDNYVQERCAILIAYAQADISLAFLTKRYPFLAKEVERQALTQADLRVRFSLDHPEPEPIPTDPGDPAGHP